MRLCLMRYNDFTNKDKPKWVACDTETFITIDGIKVSSDELKTLGSKQELSWFREHARVDVYAWLISDGTHFAWLESFEEFTNFIAEHNIKVCWWYNAKFDFAQIDYQLLTKGWLQVDKEVEPKTYDSLHSDKGMRYSLSLNIPYKDSCHRVKNYDFYNFFNQGLKKCLINFNVVDYDGNDIRKLEMDYQQGDNIEYMKNDVSGLYHLVRIAGLQIESYGLKIFKNRPDVFTAGALAKKMLLRSLYKTEDDEFNVKVFKNRHPINYELDDEVRQHGLYRGGLTTVNSRYVNKLLRFNIYKYDFNSMYPSVMAVMPDLRCMPKLVEKRFEARYPKERFCRILIIKRLMGFMKDGMLPFWYSHITKDFTKEPYIEDSDDALYIFEDELIEMQEWYDLDFHYDSLLVIDKMKEKGYKDFVDKFYKDKTDAKIEGNASKQQFAKLLLNSSYGKLSENPRRLRSHRELNDKGAVHLVPDCYEINDTKTLNVIQGALITSMARIKLLRAIRLLCKVPARDFIYCDTDSISTRNYYADYNDTELGALGYEGCFNASIYLAPKTYLNMIVDGEKVIELNAHTKGVPVINVLSEIEGKTVSEVSKIFSPLSTFNCLAGLNIVGGKALIPVKKCICKPDNVSIVLGDALVDEHDKDLELYDLDTKVKSTYD